MTSGPNFSVKNRNQVLRAIRRTERDVITSLKAQSKVIAENAAGEIRSTAAGTSPQARAASASVRARAGAVPKIAVGGSTRVSTSSGPKRAGDLFGGSEWGSDLSPQFGRPWAAKGAWFFGTIRRRGRFYAQEWIDSVDRAIRRSWR